LLLQKLCIFFSLKFSKGQTHNSTSQSLQV